MGARRLVLGLILVLALAGVLAGLYVLGLVRRLAHQADVEADADTAP
jgi:hypothetical protein